MPVKRFVLCVYDGGGPSLVGSNRGYDAHSYDRDVEPESLGTTLQDIARLIGADTKFLHKDAAGNISHVYRRDWVHVRDGTGLGAGLASVQGSPPARPPIKLSMHLYPWMGIPDQLCGWRSIHPNALSAADVSALSARPELARDL